MEDNNQTNTNSVAGAAPDTTPDTPVVTTPSVTESTTTSDTTPVSEIPAVTPIEVAETDVLASAPQTEVVSGEATVNKSSAVKQYAIALGIVVLMGGGVF